MLEGFRTFWDGFLSFRAFWTAMPSPLFLISTPADKRQPLIAGALMVQVGPCGKEAMFTRSTCGCDHSGAHCLALAACLCPKLHGSARRPGLSGCSGQDPASRPGGRPLRPACSSVFKFGPQQLEDPAVELRVSLRPWRKPKNKIRPGPVQKQNTECKPGSQQCQC